jgi:hypothetical protein
LLGRFSYLTDPIEPRTEVSRIEFGRFTHARRAAHADSLVDCFLVRDRMCELTRLEEALGLAEPAPEAGRLENAS